MDLPNLEVNLMFPAGFIHDLLHLLADSGVSQVDVLQFSWFGRVDALSQGLETGAAPEASDGASETVARHSRARGGRDQCGR